MFCSKTFFSWFLRTHGRVLGNNKKTSVAGYSELLICILLLFIFHVFICILLTQDYFRLKAKINRHALLGFTYKKLNKWGGYATRKHSWFKVLFEILPPFPIITLGRYLSLKRKDSLMALNGLTHDTKATKLGKMLLYKDGR